MKTAEFYRGISLPEEAIELLEKVKDTDEKEMKVLFQNNREVFYKNILKGKIRGSAFCIIIHRWRVIYGKNTKKEGFHKKYIGILFLILQSGARTAKKRLENMDFVSMNGCFVILI